jgi:hypothetical protein
MVTYRRVRWSRRVGGVGEQRARQRRAGGVPVASNGLGGGGWALQDQEEDTVLIF